MDPGKIAKYIEVQLRDMFGDAVAERILSDVWLKVTKNGTNPLLMPPQEARKWLRKVAGRVKIDQYRENVDLFGRKGAKKPRRAENLDDLEV